MADPFAHLQKLDLAGMGRANPKQQVAKIDATVGLDADQILRAKYEKHEQDFRVRTRQAKQLLERLPDAGEVFTVLMSGSFDGFDYVRAILDLAAPVTIDELFVATLGFSEDNGGQLLGMLDSGQIKRVWFVASCYMRDKHGDKFARLSQMLQSRGQHIRATRNHAKILAMKLSDGRKLAIDGSLNLCSTSIANTSKSRPRERSASNERPEAPTKTAEGRGEARRPEAPFRRRREGVAADRRSSCAHQGIERHRPPSP
jgi:hypothetical protein